MGTRLSGANGVPWGQSGGPLSVAVLSLCERDYPAGWAQPWREGSRQAVQLVDPSFLPLSPVVICSGSFLLSTLISVSNQLTTLCAT